MCVVTLDCHIFMVAFFSIHERFNCFFFTMPSEKGTTHTYVLIQDPSRKIAINWGMRKQSVNWLYYTSNTQPHNKFPLNSSERLFFLINIYVFNKKKVIDFRFSMSFSVFHLIKCQHDDVAASAIAINTKVTIHWKHIWLHFQFKIRIFVKAHKHVRIEKTRCKLELLVQIVWIKSDPKSKPTSFKNWDVCRLKRKICL